MRWLFESPKVSWAKIRSAGLVSKPRFLPPGGERVPSVSLLASPLSRKKERDGWQDESQEKREKGRREGFLVHSVSCALYTQLSLSGISCWHHATSLWFICFSLLAGCWLKQTNKSLNSLHCPCLSQRQNLKNEKTDNWKKWIKQIQIYELTKHDNKWRRKLDKHCCLFACLWWKMGKETEKKGTKVKKEEAEREK